VLLSFANPQSVPGAFTVTADPTGTDMSTPPPPTAGAVGQIQQFDQQMDQIFQASQQRGARWPSRGAHLTSQDVVSRPRLRFNPLTDRGKTDVYQRQVSRRHVRRSRQCRSPGRGLARRQKRRQGWLHDCFAAWEGRRQCTGVASRAIPGALGVGTASRAPSNPSSFSFRPFRSARQKRGETAGKGG
jgi:hypothetical protein